MSEMSYTLDQESQKRKEEYEKREQKRLKKLKFLGNEFGFLGLLSIVYGIVASFCLYRNPMGIMVPVFVAFTYGSAFFILKRYKQTVKRGSVLIAGAAFLIALSTCFTGNWIIGYYMNRTALTLLFCIFILHQRYEDTKWNIGKYMGAVFLYLGQALGMFFYPFIHLKEYLVSVKNKKYRNLILFFTGLCAAIPIVIFLSLLLASADMVFQNMLDTVLREFLNPVTIFLVVLQSITWMITIYCLICSAYAGDIEENVKDQRKSSPVMSISFMSMIAIVYIAFCAIQILYLFMGRGLPENMTYSEYARQGFFQLLFVVTVNLVMVLMCLKYFRKNSILNGVLFLISLCTYVMIASAIYRMLLYVGQYHLTFLRVLVLWFLAMITVLMSGVVILIFQNQFPLFRFCLAVISVFYIGLAWMKPDQIIASYNLAHWEQGNENYRYAFRRLSSDAAKSVASLEKGEERDWLLDHYSNSYNDIDNGHMGIRTFNFSVWRARKLNR